MDEEVQLYLDDTKEQMEKAVGHFSHEMMKLRAGKANPQILEGIFVDYYGAHTPLAQVANINSPDAKSLVIQPWDKKMIDPIEKAILAANIGITPMNNGEIVRLNFPPLTEERRKLLVKQVKHEGENARVSIRNSRRDLIEEIKKMQKNGLPEDLAKITEEKADKLTEMFYKKVEEVIAAKEKEIMTI
jgi:ribosome recycling factor